MTTRYTGLLVNLSLYQVAPGLLNNQLVPWENHKHLMFNIKPIQIAVKKIINTVILKKKQFTPDTQNQLTSVQLFLLNLSHLFARNCIVSSIPI